MNTNIKLLISASILLATSTACALGNKRPPSEPPVSTQPTTPAPNPPPSSGNSQTAISTTPLWEGKVSAGKQWTSHVLQELDRVGQNILDVIPADSELFCPNYKNLTYNERKDYWAFVISSMVKFESNFKPETSYKEGFNDSSGNAVISRGLLQISIESGNAYGCGFKSAQELHDPYKNLSCGIRILDRWLDRDGRIAGKVSNQWRGGARYWSVLRAGDKTSYKSILSWSQNLKICKN